MNKHVLLVMKWLNSPDSVTQGELFANRKDADRAATLAAAADADRAADRAAALAAADAAYAERRVDVFFKRSGENKQDYIEALS